MALPAKLSPYIKCMGLGNRKFQTKLSHCMTLDELPCKLLRSPSVKQTWYQHLTHRNVIRLCSNVPSSDRSPPTIHTDVPQSCSRMFAFIKQLSTQSFFPICKLYFSLLNYLYVLLLPPTGGSDPQGLIISILLTPWIQLTSTGCGTLEELRKWLQFRWMNVKYIKHLVKYLAYNFSTQVGADTVITGVVTFVAGATITVPWERNIFWSWGRAQHESFSEEAKTLFNDCISSFKNQNAPMSDFSSALNTLVPW